MPITTAKAPATTAIRWLMTRTDAAFFRTSRGSELNGATLSVRDAPVGAVLAVVALAGTSFLRLAGVALAAVILMGAVASGAAGAALIDVVLTEMVLIGAVSSGSAGSAGAAGLACALRFGALPVGVTAGVMNGSADEARWRATRTRRG
jgi:hypothetical protein